MTKKEPKKKLREIDRYDLLESKNLGEKAVIICAPSAVALAILTLAGYITPALAVVCFGTIVFTTVILLAPYFIERQKIQDYIEKLAKGEKLTDEEKKLFMSDNETKIIVNAINDMHNIWNNKASELEAQTISDSAVLDSLPDPLIMLDKDGLITGANLSARDTFGHNIRNKSIDNLFQNNKFISSVKKVLEKESLNENIVFYIQKPWNKKLYAHIKQLPWLSKGKAVAVISLYDLTKSMKLEQMQADFVANASHELRTPLAVLSGFIETLQTSAKDDEKARESFLAIMDQQSKHMKNLIENLLSLSRIEMKQDALLEDVIKIRNVIENTKKALKQKAESKHMKITSSIAKDLPEIVCDESQITQIIQNLTDNAIKYGDKKTNIFIKTNLVKNMPTSLLYPTNEGKAIAISINNKGEPISEENLNRLTERFYRLQQHKNKGILGAGLGLSITKHIITRHNGYLDIKSSKEKGTTFTVYLPVK